MKFSRSTESLLLCIFFAIGVLFFLTMLMLGIIDQIPASSLLIRISGSCIMAFGLYKQMDLYKHFRKVEKGEIPEPHIRRKNAPAREFKDPIPKIPAYWRQVAWLLTAIAIIGEVFYFLGYHPGWTFIHVSKLVTPGGPEIPLLIRFDYDRTIWGMMYILAGGLTFMAKVKTNIPRMYDVGYNTFKYAAITTMAIEVINIFAIPFKYHT